jgi:hypothetical protein
LGEIVILNSTRYVVVIPMLYRWALRKSMVVQ